MRGFQPPFRFVYLCLYFKMLLPREVAAHKPQRLSSWLSSGCHCTRFYHSKVKSGVDCITELIGHSCLQENSHSNVLVILCTAVVYNAVLVSKPRGLHHHLCASTPLHWMLFARRTLKQFLMGKKATSRIPHFKVRNKRSRANGEKIPSDFQRAQRPGQSSVQKDSLRHLLSPSDHPWGAGTSSPLSDSRWWESWIWTCTSAVLFHQRKLAL